MSSLAGKVVIVTGASSGIGKAVAVHLASLGAGLSLFARRTDRLEQVAQECKEIGTSRTEVCVVGGDIIKDEDRHTLISQTIQRFGQLDVLVNNAGTGGHFQTASDITEKNFDHVFNTNLKATVLLTKLAIPYLKQTKGNIVNNSSMNARMSVPPAAIYCMAKAALDMYTRCLALDMAPYGVRVNSINPGAITTDIWRNTYKTAAGEAFDEKQYQEVGFFYEKSIAIEDFSSRIPFKRFGTPEEVAKAVGFLVSEDASYISGHHLYIDGARVCFCGES